MGTLTWYVQYVFTSQSSWIGSRVQKVNSRQSTTLGLYVMYCFMNQTTSLIFNDADASFDVLSFLYREPFHRKLRSHPSYDHLHLTRLENFQSCPEFL